MRTHIPLSRTDSRRAKLLFGASPRTFAVPLLSAGASEAEWLAARAQGRIGASELAALLHLSPHMSRFSLWWSKQETWVRPDASEAMRIGHKLEDVIGQLWAEQHPDMLLCRPGSALYGHAVPEHGWLVCTPDFLAVAEDRWDEQRGQAARIEPVECKSDEGGRGWGAPGSDEVPDHHRVQVYAQCEILGADRGHLMRLAGKRATAYVLPYDEQARYTMAGWLDDGAAFVESLTSGEYPDVDGHAATTAALQQIHAAYVDGTSRVLTDALITEYRELHDMVKRTKAAFDEAGNKVRAALGDAQIGTDARGVKVVRRNIYKRRGYEVGPTMVDELRRVS